jgi:hypothetical protein
MGDHVSSEEKVMSISLKTVLGHSAAGRPRMAKFGTVAVAGVTLSLTLAIGSRAAQARGDQGIPKPINEVLWWLPEDTEAVMVARGPFQITRFEKDDPPLEGAGVIEYHVHASFSLALHGLLDEPLKEKAAEMLFDRPVALAIQGSRRIRPFVEGSMHLEGAWIVIFQDDLGKAGKSWLDGMRAGKSRDETISGSRDVVKTYPQIGDEVATYYAHPRPNMLVCATNLSYLKSVLDRMAKRATVRALPLELPEWKDLDSSAKVWALRHYKRKDAALDMTSPLGKEGEGDEQAIGFAFWPDPQKGQANVRYLSTNQVAIRHAHNIWSIGNEGPELECLIRQTQRGVVSITVPLQKAVARNPEHPGDDGVASLSSSFLFVVRLMWAIGQPL